MLRYNKWKPMGKYFFFCMYNFLFEYCCPKTYFLFINFYHFVKMEFSFLTYLRHLSDFVLIDLLVGIIASKLPIDVHSVVWFWQKMNCTATSKIEPFQIRTLDGLLIFIRFWRNLFIRRNFRIVFTTVGATGND